MMDRDELNELNQSIASLHKEGDVYSYEIDRDRQIEFPRGFLRSLRTYRSFFPFVEDEILREKIANHMMHRDTLHWLWLKTDIGAWAREMVVKFQLINLASILEAIIKTLKPKMPGKKDNMYDRIDALQEEKLINNAAELKELWAARNSIHLHLTGNKETVEYSDENYKLWHSAMATLINNLNTN
jgi:hypothetical protein